MNEKFERRSIEAKSLTKASFSLLTISSSLVVHKVKLKQFYTTMQSLKVFWVSVYTHTITLKLYISRSVKFKIVKRSYKQVKVIFNEFHKSTKTIITSVYILHDDIYSTKNVISSICIIQYCPTSTLCDQNQDDDESSDSHLFSLQELQ